VPTVLVCEVETISGELVQLDDATRAFFRIGIGRRISGVASA
jgi:hypothetical protein